VTRIFCLLTVHNIIWNLFEMTPALMSVALSVDRLLLVSTPLWYIRQTCKYAVVIVGGIFAHGFLSSMVRSFSVFCVHILRFEDWVCVFTPK
jgi:hypothetical protein